MEDELLQLLALWRETRDPRVADAIDRVGAGLRSEPLAGKTLAKQLDSWLAIAARHEARDVSGLMALPFPTGINALRRLVEGLLVLPEDPRVARRLTDLLVELPVDSYAGRALTKLASRRLVALRDVRAVPRLQALRRGTWELAQAGVDTALSGLATVVPLVVDDAILAPHRAPERDVMTEAKFLDQIYASPDDDGAIAVYGDWLSEQGDPRGELIALQLLDAEKRTDKRERELIAEHGASWIGPLAALFPRDHVFERGFFAGGRAVTAITDAHVAEPSWSLIRVLAVRSFEDVGSRAPRLRELHLDLDASRTLDEARFAATPELRVLGVWGGPPNLAAWCANAPVIERLDRLVLYAPDPGVVEVLANRIGLREVEIVEPGDRFHVPTTWCVRLSRDAAPGPFTKIAALRRDGSTQKAPELVSKLDRVPAGPIVELVATSRPIMLESYDVERVEASLVRFANASRVEVPWLRPGAAGASTRTIAVMLDGVCTMDDRLAGVWDALARAGQRYDVFAVNNSPTRRPLGTKPVERLLKWAPRGWLDLFNTGGQETVCLGSGGLGTTGTLVVGVHSPDGLRALFLELFARTGSMAGTLGPLELRFDLGGLGQAPRAGWLMAFSPSTAARLDRTELAALADRPELSGLVVLPVEPLVLQLAATPEAVTPEAVAVLAREMLAILQRGFVATHGFDFRAAVRAVLDPIAEDYGIPLGAEGPLEVRYYTPEFLEIRARLSPELHVSASNNNRAGPPYYHTLANGVVIESPAKLDAELARVAAALRELRSWFPG